MTRTLTVAEQCIDRRERTEVFEGHQMKADTGRVLLHALDADTGVLCGYERDQLTPVARPWDSGYLPHLARCQGCVRAARGDQDDEYQSLSEVLGQAEASAELAQHVSYSWLYEQILADPPWFAGYLARHGLSVPIQPPVPRRYFGDAWWTLL